MSNQSENSLLDTKFIVYSYISPDGKPGTVIMHQNLSKAFQSGELIEMDYVKSITLSLKDLLEKGFWSVGDLDTMEDMDIHYPILPNTKYPEKIVCGAHMSMNSNNITALFPSEMTIRMEESDTEDDLSFDVETESKESDENITVSINTQNNEEYCEVDSNIFLISEESQPIKETSEAISDDLDEMINFHNDKIDGLLGEIADVLSSVPS